MTELKPDILQLKSEEARGFLREANLRNEVLVLEDQYEGEVVGRVLLGGGPDQYTLVGEDLETGRDWEKQVDRDEAAQTIAGWTVVERRRDDGSPVASFEEGDSP